MAAPELKIVPTPFRKWMEKEGPPIIDTWGVEDVLEVPMGPWPRMGGNGAFIELAGLQGFVSMYVVEIPPRSSLNVERHLYEEVMFVSQGRGSMEVWNGGDEKRKQVLEWGKGSMFSPPLNTWHRLVNPSSEPAVLVGGTDAPIILDLYRNPEFVFNCDFNFTERYDGQSDYFAASGEKTKTDTVNTFDTNFFPDVQDAVLDFGGFKNPAGTATHFEMSGNAFGGHIMEGSLGIYGQGHYHAAGAVLLVLRSEGYSLLWPKNLLRPWEEGREDEVIEVKWKPGSLFSPPDGWFHQHFNTGTERDRIIAFKHSSRTHPFGVRYAMGGGRAETGIPIRLGGQLLEYADEDPMIRIKYEEALKRNGVESGMGPIFDKALATSRA